MEVGGNLTPVKTGGIGIRSGWRALDSGLLISFAQRLSLGWSLGFRQKAVMRRNGLHVRGGKQKHHKSSVIEKAIKRTTYVRQNHLFKLKLHAKINNTHLRSTYKQKDTIWNTFEWLLLGWEKKGRKCSMSGKPRARLCGPGMAGHRELESVINSTLF